MRHILTIALALFATVASAATITAPTVCAVTGSNIACNPLNVDMPQAIALQRITHAQVYQGPSLPYIPAYTDVTLTIDGQDYVTQPNTGFATNAAQGPQIWQGTAYAAGLPPVVYTLNFSMTFSPCSGRGCQPKRHYTVLAGTVQ